jgi:TRAP-type C4-dicarboxylate transport system substrate-binding protein
MKEKPMRASRGRWSLVSVVAIASVLLAACSSDGPDDVSAADAAPTGAAEDDSTAAPADDTAGDDVAAGNAVSLNAGHFMAPQHPMHERLLVPLQEQIAQVTDGRVDITIHPGGALGPPPAQWDSAVSGVMDIAFGLHGYTPERFPLTEIVELPMIFSSGQQATAALQHLFDTFPEIQAEHEGVKVLAIWTHDTGQLLMADEAVRQPEDLRGRSIVVPGPLQASLVEALGGTAVIRPVTEMYDSLERGVADGVTLPLSSLVSFNLDEVINHATIGGIYISTFFLTMNLDAWNSLSEADQAAVDEVIGHALGQQAAQAYTKAEELGFQRMEEAGIEVHELSDEELQRWRELMAPVHQEWIAKREAQGLPAQQAYDELIEFVQNNP